MSKQCFFCNTLNPDNAHYCGTCGKPLEKRYLNSLEKLLYKSDVGYVEYTVVKKSEYKGISTENRKLKAENQGLKAENDRLKRKINDTLWNKIKNLCSEVDKEDLLWGGGLFAVIITVVFLVYMCSGKSGIEIVEENGKYGIYNHDNNTQTVPYECDSIQHYDNFYLLYKGEYKGMANAKGVKTIDFMLDSIQNIGYGVVRTFGKEKQGLTDNEGNVIINCAYHRVLWDGTQHTWWSFYEVGKYVGYIIPVRETADSKWTLYNRKGNVITNKRYIDVRQSGAYSLVRVTEPYGYVGLIDSTGNVVLPPKYKYSHLSIFENGRAWKKDDFTWSCINERGATVFSLSNNNSLPSLYSDSLCAIYTGDDIEYYDVDGNIVIPKKYKRAKNKEGVIILSSFYNGRAFVSYNGKNGYIDKKGIFTEEEPN